MYHLIMYLMFKVLKYLRIVEGPMLKINNGKPEFPAHFGIRSVVLVASLHHHNNHYDQKICECSSNLDFLMIFYAESNALLWIRSTFGFLHSSRKIIVKN